MKELIEKLRPYVNVKYNELCFNPEETNRELVSSLTWAEIANICSFEGSESDFRKCMIKSGLLGEVNFGESYYVLMNPEYCCKSVDAARSKYWFDYKKDANWSSSVYNPDVYSELKDILLILERKEGGLVVWDFSDVDCLAEHLETSPTSFLEILDGVRIEDEVYKHNIYYNGVGENQYYICLIVYKEDWVNYSMEEKDERLNKLTEGRWSIR